MKKYLLVILATWVLTGCPTRPPEPSKPAVIEPISKPESPPPTYEPIPQPPKIQQFDWPNTVQPLVAQMLMTEGVKSGSVLLLDRAKNSTNGSLTVSDVNVALYQALTPNNVFVLVPEDKLATARRTLGLSPKDSLISRSKAIGLARILNAQYVLYSDVSGDVTSPILEMQLMQVETGEIVWSGQANVQQ